MITIDINTINPYIRVAMHSVLTKGHRIERRVIFDYELIYVENGEMTFYYDDIAYECKKGQLILIRPGIPHAFDCTRQELSQPHIHFDIIYSSESTKTPVSFKDITQMTLSESKLIQNDLFCDYPRVPFVVFSDPEHSLPLFYKVIDLFSSNQKLLAKCAFIELIHTLICDNFPACLSSGQEISHDIAQQLKDLIDSTHGVHFSLDILEKQFSYSKFYLERKFKEHYGVSLIHYANQKRMERAEALLQNLTVSEVAERSGFSSIYSFSRAFKNHFGCSPSEIGKKDRT